MGCTKVFFTALIFLFLVSGCEQAEDFTPAEINKADERQPASFVPFSDVSLYLDGTAGTDPDAGIDAVTLMGGGRLISFYSFSIWFKMDTDAASGTFFQMDNNPDVGFDLSWEPSTGNLKFDHLFEHMGGTTSSRLMTEIGNPQAWNHIVVTCEYDGASFPSTVNTLKLYHNGGLVQEEAVESDQIFWGIGRKFVAFPITNKLSPAYVDEMAVWNKTLNSNEVQALYGEGAPGDLSLTHSDVDAWWRLGETGYPPTMDDEIVGHKFTLMGDISLSSDIARPDPFGGEGGADPLNDAESGDGTTSGGGSDPLEGGSGGFGGDLGDGGSSGNFP